MRILIVFILSTVTVDAAAASISSGLHQLESAVRSIILNQSLDVQLFIERQQYQPRSDFNLNFLIKSAADGVNPITVSVGKLMKSQRSQLVVMVMDELLGNETEIESMRVNDFHLIIASTTQRAPKGESVATFLNHTWERKRIVNINVIISDGGDINLLTFFPFADEGCSNGGNIKVVNKFNENTWESRDFFPPKLINFHGCALKLGTQQSAPAAERVMGRRQQYEYVGSDIRIAREFERFFNFTNNFQFDDWWGNIYENGSGDYNLGKLLRRDIDYVVGWHFLNLVKSKFLDYTQPYFFVPFVIIIPSGAPFSSLENLLRCFTPPLWMAFIVSCMLFYVITFTINYAIRRRSDQLRVHYELLVIIILGESTAKRLPTRNSIRLTIMTFIIFCFIMRTAYVSEMFNLLQSGSNDKQINSLEDLRDQKYTLYTPNFIESYISLSEIRYDRKLIQMLGPFDDENQMKRVHNPSFRGAFLEPLDIVIRGNDNSSSPYNILSEPLSTTPVVIYFQRNSYLRDVFNAKLQQMFEAGLIERWIRQRWKSREMGLAVGSGEPKVLSMGHLSAAFTIAIGGMCLSLIAFVAEIYSMRLKARKFNRDAVA